MKQVNNHNAKYPNAGNLGAIGSTLRESTVHPLTPLEARSLALPGMLVAALPSLCQACRRHVCERVGGAWRGGLLLRMFDKTCWQSLGAYD